MSVCQGENYDEWTYDQLMDKIIEMTLDQMPQWMTELEGIDQYLERQLDYYSHEELVNLIEQME